MIGTQGKRMCLRTSPKSSAFRAGPGLLRSPESARGSDTAQAVRFLALVHRNMNTIYSNKTAIPPGNTDSINDHDGASKRAFDVYGTYQHALADTDVSIVLSVIPGIFTKSRYPPHWQQFNLSRSSLRPPRVWSHILVPFSTP